MIKVTAWEPIDRIVTIDIQGSITQATAPAELFTEADWMHWLSAVIQPVVDDIIRARTYDPNQLLQIGDLSTSTDVLTQSEIDKLAVLFPAKAPS